ncbi:MAG TPA: class I SAM-dependent methyltransferase [Caldilineaceae bacterium]|nr:class I SAM-dependent methyltransferase [Caldilineaceae bacterium]
MDATPSWEMMYRDEKYRWFWPPAYDPITNAAEVANVIRLLAAEPDTRLLDLACGLGWLTIPLAQQGFDVTGFDLSATLLNRAEAAANEAGASVAWVRGDMRALPDAWTASFDYVTLTLSEFGCFPEEADNQQVLTDVARVLKPGGRFLLDLVVNRDGLVHGNLDHCLDGGSYVVSAQGSFDLITGIHTREYYWYYDGERHETTWQIRAYTPPEVAGMLQRAGLNVNGVFANLAGAELARNSVGMTFVAQKPG